MPLQVFARLIVLASASGAVATGCWLLAPLGVPSAAAGAAFLVSAIAARFRFAWTAVIVLCVAYTAYGMQRLVAGAAMAAVPLWLAAFAGVAVGGASWHRWAAPPTWRVPLAWWGLGVALSWPIVAAREMDFATDGPRTVAGVVVSTALLHLALVLWMDTLLGSTGPATARKVPALQKTPAAAEVSPRLLRALSWALLASAFVSSLAAMQQRAFDMTWLSGEPWVRLGRAVGMMGDANPMGAATAVWAPLAVVMLGTFGWTVAAFLWAAAWLSGSRTTLVLIVAGLVGLSLRPWAGRRPSLRVVALTAVMVFAVGASLVWLLPRAGDTTPLGRLRGSLSAASPTSSAYEVLWRRDGYGLAANTAIAMHPFTGVGVGVFNTLSSSYHRLTGGGPLPPDNAQNLWRHTLAERGLLGLLPLLWLTALTAHLVFSPTHPSMQGDAPSRQTASRRMVLRAVIVGFGLALMVGFPVQDPAIAMTLATLVAMLAATSASSSVSLSHARESTPDGATNLLWAGVMVLSFVAAGIDYASATSSLGLPARAARGNAQYVKGFGAQEPAPDGTTARPVRNRATMVLPVAGRQFVLRGWVRSADGPTHVRVWHEQALIVDETLADGATFSRTLELTPGGPGLQVTLDTSRGDLLFAGQFENP